MTKIAFIGAGSLGFTAELVRDVLTFPLLEDATISLMDIDAERLEWAKKGVEKLIAVGKRPAKVIATLDRAVALARGLGLRFRIFDAFRPTEAQWVLWRAFPDPTFLADPRRGSPHSRGVAVDLEGNPAAVTASPIFHAIDPALSAPAARPSGCAGGAGRRTAPACRAARSS